MDKIKLAISNIAWEKEYDKNVYEYLKENNIPGLEIAPTRIFEEKPYEQLENAKQYSEMLKADYNLEIVSMQSIWFGKTQNMFQDEKDTLELIEYTKKAIDFANEIGCKNLVFGCPKNRNMSNYEEDYGKALKFFKEIGEYALQNNVVVAVEPNPVIYNTNFLNYTEQAIEFVKEIGLESIKVNYDLGTVIYNEESLEILKNNIDYIHHIHISEPNLECIKQRKMHEELGEIVKNSNYKGYVSIEMKKHDIQKVKQTIDYVRGIYVI